MPGTFPIPQQTIDPAHGPYLFGPQSVAPNDSKIVMTLDRTVAGGLNATPAAYLTYVAEQSNDGGTTWFVAVGSDAHGGPPPNDRFGSPLPTQATVDVYGSGPGRQLRVTVNASGAPVVIAGTLAVT